MSNERRTPDLSEQQVNGLLRSYLREEWHEDANRVASSVLDELDTTPQRRSRWEAWRSSVMNNNIVRVGLAVAAVVVIAIIAINLLPGSTPPGGDPSPSPSAESSEAAVPSAQPSTWTGIAEGPFVVTGIDDPVQVTVDIATPGWSHSGEHDFVYKDDDGQDAPEAVGGALLAWTWPAGTEFDVYGDPCQWSTTIPATPATTPDEIAAGLAAQAESEGTAPVDITLDGYAGKAITVQVPMSYYIDATATRDEEFAACDERMYGFYGSEVEPGPHRNAQGPGQVDELWIVDVDGAIVILDATYGPEAPAALVDEMRAMAESATFEVN